MREFTVGSVNYRTSRKLNAIQQFHVSRRIAPLVAVMGIEVMSIARAPGTKDDALAMQRFAGMFPALAEVLSKMSDEDTNYILHTCLKVVQRQVEGDRGWQLVVAEGGAFMFDDIEMDAMLQIVVEVLRENLAGFLKGLGGSTPSPSS